VLVAFTSKHNTPLMSEKGLEANPFKYARGQAMALRPASFDYRVPCFTTKGGVVGRTRG